MSQKLTDLSQKSLVRANRANLYELFLSLADSPFFNFSTSGGLTRWNCSLQYAWFNAILCGRDALPADAGYLDESLTFFKNKNTSAMTLWLEDSVNRAGWDALLLPRGFQFEEGPYGMSADLTELNEAVDHLPDGGEIKVVDDDQTMRDCADTIVDGYGFPPDWREFTHKFVHGNQTNPAYRSYVAYWNGKPVATAGVLFGEEVAGIYTVATLPEARGKGFGAATTLAPLRDARKMGYRAGILQASSMGFPVYKRMGFKHDFNVGLFIYNF